MTEATLKYGVGDPVFVHADNYGSEAVIVALRDSDGSHYKVRQPDGQEFWAFDYEVSDLLTEAEIETNKVTWQHIEQVRTKIKEFQTNLEARARVHDQSKLERPEVQIFAEYTPKLAASTYGSDEYRRFLAEMKPALDHHYAHNSHHPEHYENGINGMSLLDVVEMICDWKAATMRHNDGNLADSLRINKERFGISDQLAQILENTAQELGWL